MDAAYRAPVAAFALLGLMAAGVLVDDLVGGGGGTAPIQATDVPSVAVAPSWSSVVDGLVADDASSLTGSRELSGLYDFGQVRVRTVDLTMPDDLLQAGVPVVGRAVVAPSSLDGSVGPTTVQPPLFVRQTSLAPVTTTSTAPAPGSDVTAPPVDRGSVRPGGSDQGSDGTTDGTVATPPRESTPETGTLVRASTRPTKANGTSVQKVRAKASAEAKRAETKDARTAAKAEPRKKAEKAEKVKAAPAAPAEQKQAAKAQRAEQKQAAKAQRAEQKQAAKAQRAQQKQAAKAQRAEQKQAAKAQRAQAKQTAKAQRAEQKQAAKAQRAQAKQAARASKPSKSAKHSSSASSGRSSHGKGGKH